MAKTSWRLCCLPPWVAREGARGRLGGGGALGGREGLAPAGPGPPQ